MPIRVLPSSLRTRLAVLFAITSAVLLAGSAYVLSVRLRSALERTVDEGLSDRADDIEAALPDVHEVVRHDPLAEVLAADNSIIDASPAVASSTHLLTRAQEARGHSDAFKVDRGPVGRAQAVRLLVRPGPDGRVIVVGSSLDPTLRAEARLGAALALASPIVIAVIAGAGWLLAGAALRPVRRMAEEAAAISIDIAGRRLPQPGGVDEIATLGRTLNDMLARIEQAVAHERAFLDDASHELRTPVAILRGELELALLDAEEPAARRALQSALDEATRLSRLAEDLLVLARADAGGLPVEPRSIDLGELVRGVVGRLPRDGGPEVTVEGDAVASADPLRVEQIVANLVDNARRVARARVAVTVAAVAGDVSLAVADDGPGFPPELVPVALDRFTRADAVRARGSGGAGLGLAIVEALARAQGGSCSVANNGPLGGAVVTVRLHRG